MEGVEGELAGVKSVAVLAVGVGGADIAALVFHGHPVVGFDVGGGGQGEGVFVDGGGVEVAEIGFVVGGVGVAGGLDGGAAEDEFDGEEGAEVGGGFFGGESFVAGINAEAASWAAGWAGADDFGDVVEAVGHEFAGLGFEDED